MGRRSYGFSTTSINRLMSASRAAQKAREREKMIQSQAGIQRERPPRYSITDFDFNTETRISHICFLEEKDYRTIERYVTQNGQKYPIYGDWKTKSKTIKKTVKLTNDCLEKLKENDDVLLSDFSFEIVTRIGNEDLYPSWFVIDVLKDDEKEQIRAVQTKFLAENQKETRSIDSSKHDLLLLNAQLDSESVHLSKTEKKKKNLYRSLTRARSKKHFVLFSILSFGVYALLHSQRRITRLENLLNRISNSIEQTIISISSIEELIRKTNECINDHLERIKNNKKKEGKEIQEIKINYSMEVSRVEPLPTALMESTRDTFIPLKQLCGMNYEKIVGCYVIRNTEKNKYYVGQSKDVLKRVCKQHFDGTKVKNIVFAEDYYSSEYENKDDLFEVRIIRLETKDELDEKEKELIEYYDSFKSGYNGTAGNT